MVDVTILFDKDIIAIKSQTAEPDPILAFDFPNLLLAYTMDNISGSIIMDESPNNRDGTINGAVSVPGSIGNALRYDGVNDWLEGGGLPAVPIMSISKRLITSDNTTPKILFELSQNVNNNVGGILISVNDPSPGDMRFVIQKTLPPIAGSTLAANALGVSINNGVYHHLIFEYNKNGLTAQDQLKVSIDDTPISLTFTGTNLTPVDTVADNFFIGDRFGGSIAPFNGDSDQLRVFNIPLSDAQKTALVNEV